MKRFYLKMQLLRANAIVLSHTSGLTILASSSFGMTATAHMTRYFFRHKYFTCSVKKTKTRRYLMIIRGVCRPNSERILKTA